MELNLFCYELLTFYINCTFQLSFCAFEMVKGQIQVAIENSSCNSCTYKCQLSLQVKMLSWGRGQPQLCKIGICLFFGVFCVSVICKLHVQVIRASGKLHWEKYPQGFRFGSVVFFLGFSVVLGAVRMGPSRSIICFQRRNVVFKNMFAHIFVVHSIQLSGVPKKWSRDKFKLEL